MNEYYVLFEFKNSGPYVQKFVSNRTVSFTELCDYAGREFDFDEERDSMTLIDDPNESLVRII